MNVKPGQLAIIIKSAAGNVGKIVEVIGPMGEHPLYAGRYWAKDEGFCWMVKGQMTSMLGLKSDHGPVPDRNLRPVSGLSDPVDVKNSIKEPA